MTSDSDGEFLLIEAAEVLPAWVSPSNAENRVWLFGSHLHLVPIFYGSSSSTPRVRRRIADEQEEDDAAMGSNTTEDDYLGISDALRLHVHRCRAYIPEDIALALHSNPSLVQRAVETFYTRDSVQLRAVHTMSRFPPSTSTLATVRLTRPAYAQLAGQNFHPPKIFGRWTEPEGSPEWKRRSIGADNSDAWPGYRRSKGNFRP
ncbi:SGT1-domain-containing protein [Clavulina sp. PMI_390]|nr:SGT1-domain-containing protein [Clavulina sp. PMI_390]